MPVWSVWLRVALVAVALGGLSGWKLLLDGPTQRTRAILGVHYKVIETYRRIHGRLPTPKEGVKFMAMMFHDSDWSAELTVDGWGRSIMLCRRGDTLVLLSRGPNGVNDGGGVDDLSIEIDP